MLVLSKDWKDYEIIDAGNGEKLERWKDVVLRRPDPQAIWPQNQENTEWESPHAWYHRRARGGGSWEYKKKLQESWIVSYKDLRFKISPTGFKHTGLFPEQAANWDWVRERIEKSKRDDIKVLNLFAYTGGATVASAAGGASEVVHVDASKGMVNWAKENVEASNLSHKKIRFMVDDVIKFIKREIRRGNKYDGIIMDPPSYGRGPNGEIWKLEEALTELLELTAQILSDDPIFVLVNSYTTGFSPIVLENIMKVTLEKSLPKGNLYCGEIGLPITRGSMVLPCGIYGRWEK